MLVAVASLNTLRAHNLRLRICSEDATLRNTYLISNDRRRERPAFGRSRLGSGYCRFGERHAMLDKRTYAFHVVQDRLLKGSCNPHMTS